VYNCAGCDAAVTGTGNVIPNGYTSVEGSIMQKLVVYYIFYGNGWQEPSKKAGQVGRGAHHGQ
jgi:hypothetical protein